jgi:homoserine dehydrogenase
VLVGAGSLGRAFLRRLSDGGVPVSLVGVLTARHGRRYVAEGLDPRDALQAIEADDLGTDGTTDLRKAIELVKPDLLVECVPQNIRTGEPSLGFLRTALDAGVHVVTANKSAIALGYRDLRHRAAKTGVTFRFEPAVLDGLPIFSFLSQIPDPKVRRVRGVLNGTSSLVLESVQLGATRTRGLARAQAQGIAEADSVLDLDGWDAAAKVALLANVWMGGALRVVDVVREGTDAIKDDELKRSAATAHYRLVAEAIKQEDGGVRATVKPTALEPRDPFFPLNGAAGGLTVELTSGTYTFLQGTYGLDDAVQGLVQDCWAIATGAPQV